MNQITLLADPFFKGYPSRVASSLIKTIALIVGLWALSATAPADATELKPLTIAMSLTPLSSPIIIAKQKGYFAKHGLDVTVKDFVGGHRAANALFSGTADIATSSEVVVMFNSFKRSDFAILNTFVSSDNDIKIITRNDTGIRTVQDLEGRRIGTVTGAAAQFFLDETLALAGVDSAQVKVVHVNPEGSPSALAGGDIDAIVVWEPFAYLSQSELGVNAVIVAHERVYTETFNALVLREYANKNPDTMEHFVRALIEATQFIKAYPQESQNIVSKRINKDIAFINSVWKDFDFEISLHQWLLTTLEAQARWAIDQHLVSALRGPNYLDYIHPGILRSIRPELVTVFH